MSFLEEPGDLAEVPLAAVLLEVLNGRESGVLAVAHGTGSSRLYLRRGLPAGAQSFGGFNPLGKVLLAEGLIDVGMLDRCLAEMARSGRLQGEVLVELGAVTREQVVRALSGQQAGYLRAISALTSGRFAFDRSAALPPWTRDVRVAPLRAIVDALEGPQAMPLVVAALQQAAGAPVVLPPGHRRLAPAFGWDAAETALLRRLEEAPGLDALLGNADDLSPERARAVVAALLLLGIAWPREPGGEAEGIPGLLTDLAELVGAGERGPATSRAPEAVVVAVAHHQAGRRSDPAEARKRRQRLLQRAMQNMGIGPLSGQPPRPRPVSHPASPTGGETGLGPAGGKAEGVEPHASGRPAAAAATSGGGITPGQAELRRALAGALPRARMVDLFERLGVPRDADRAAVKGAWLGLARSLHPDRFAAPGLADLAPQVKDLFASLNEAYEVLSDDRKRKEYLDRTAGGSDERPGASGAAIDFQKAEACTRTRDFAKARAFYEAALRADPRPAYQLALATALHQDPRGDRVRARELAESAQRDPGCAERAAVLGGLLARDAGDEAAAAAHLRVALRLNPNNPEARRELEVLERRPTGAAVRATQAGGGGPGPLRRR